MFGLEVYEQQLRGMCSVVDISRCLVWSSTLILFRSWNIEKMLKQNSEALSRNLQWVCAPAEFDLHEFKHRVISMILLVWGDAGRDPVTTKRRHVGVGYSWYIKKLPWYHVKHRPIENDSDESLDIEASAVINIIQQSLKVTFLSSKSRRSTIIRSPGCRI